MTSISKKKNTRTFLILAAINMVLMVLLFTHHLLKLIRNEHENSALVGTLITFFGFLCWSAFMYLKRKEFRNPQKETKP